MDAWGSFADGQVEPKLELQDEGGENIFTRSRA